MVGSDATAGIRLRLVGGFELVVDGRTCDLTPAGARLLAYLALQPHPVPRSRVACVLWDRHEEQHAAACLRSTMWRANQGAGITLVSGDRTLLALHDGVVVDVRATSAAAHAQLAGHEPNLSAAQLVGDLLPGWYDEWVCVERQRLHLVFLEALEDLAQTQLERGRTHLAIEAALTLVSADPLREAAYLLLVRGYLRTGNRPEAWRQYLACRALLRDELGLRPGPAMTRLVSMAFPRAADAESAYPQVCTAGPALTPAGYG